MNMKTKLSTRLGEIQEKLKSGLPVPVQFFDMESSYIEEFDDSFVAFVTNIEVGEDHISIFLEWSQFTEHNKRIDKCRYYDDKNQPTLSFFDSKFYPKNHKTDFYIDEQEAFEHIAILEDVTPFLNPPKVPISKEDLLALLKENLTIKLNVECKQDNAYMRVQTTAQLLFDGQEICTGKSYGTFQNRFGDLI